MPLEQVETTATEIEGEEYVTRMEAAEMTGMHYNTIRAMQARGDLKRVEKIGPRGVMEALIPLSQVKELIAERGLRQSVHSTDLEWRTIDTNARRLLNQFGQDQAGELRAKVSGLEAENMMLREALSSREAQLDREIREKQSLMEHLFALHARGETPPHDK